MEDLVKEKFEKVRRKRARQSIICIILICVSSFALGFLRSSVPEVLLPYEILVNFIFIGLFIAALLVLINFVRSEEDDYAKAQNVTIK